MPFIFSRSVQITSESESVDLTTKTDSSLTWYTYLPQELTAEEGVVFFDPESPFFQKMLNICAGLLAAACLFGIIYHLVFYKPIQRKKHGTSIQNLHSLQPLKPIRKTISISTKNFLTAIQHSVISPCTYTWWAGMVVEMLNFGFPNCL